MLLTDVVESLVGGVSQQGRALRLASQTLKQENAYGTVTDGLTKRPPTEYIARVASNEYGEFGLHGFSRNSGDEYLAVWRNASLRVYDTYGHEYPIRFAAGFAGFGFGYLSLARDAKGVEDLALWQAGAGTFPITAQTLAGPGPLGSPLASYYLAKSPGSQVFGTYNSAPSTAAVIFSGPQVVSMYVRAVQGSTPAEFAIGLRDSVKQVEAGVTFSIQATGKIAVKGDATFGAVGFLEYIGDAWYRVSVMVDTDKTPVNGVKVGNAAAVFCRIYGEDNPKSITIQAWGPRIDWGVAAPVPYFQSTDYVRAVTVQDTTIFCNGLIQTKYLADLTPVFDDTTGLVFVRQGAYSTKYTVTVKLSNGSINTATINTFNGVDTGISGKLDSSDTTAIASEIANRLNFSSSTVLAAFVAGSVVRITALGSTKIVSLTVSDGLGDEAMVAVYKQVELFSDLPAKCYDGFRVRVSGSPESDGDDYWVTFTAKEAGNFGDGEWSEVPAPAIQYRFDKTSLPFQLVRKQDTAGGTATGAPYQIYFEWGPADWGNRLAGDDDSAPPPSFMSTTAVPAYVEDVFFYRNRLGIISGSNAVFSAAGRYFDFWRSSVANLPDDDPIDIGLNAEDASRIDYVVEFADRLFIHTPEGQWSVTAEPVLSPTNVQVLQVGAWDSLAGVRPVSIDRTLYAPFQRGIHSGVRVLYETEAGTLDAVDISAHIPRYIPGEILSMEASSAESTLVATCNGDPLGLYVYKWAQTRDGLAQSSWSRFSFNEGRVVAVAFFKTSLYLLIRRGAATQLEVLDFAQRDSASLATVVHLDQGLTSRSPGVSTSYNGATLSTTITLPWAPSASQAYQLVLDADGTALDATYASANSLTVPGNVTDKIWRIGQVYGMEVVIAPPVLRRPSQSGALVEVAEGRYQITHGWLQFDQTTYFEITTKCHNRTWKDVFGAPTAVAPVTGKKRLPALCAASDLTLTITSDAPYTVKLMSMEWVARYTTHAVR